MFISVLSNLQQCPWLACFLSFWFLFFFKVFNFFHQGKKVLNSAVEIIQEVTVISLIREDFYLPNPVNHFPIWMKNNGHLNG